MLHLHSQDLSRTLSSLPDLSLSEPPPQSSEVYSWFRRPFPYFPILSLYVPCFSSSLSCSMALSFPYSFSTIVSFLPIYSFCVPCISILCFSMSVISRYRWVKTVICYLAVRHQTLILPRFILSNSTGPNKYQTFSRVYHSPESIHACSKLNYRSTQICHGLCRQNGSGFILSL